jgi:hypothetical protein
LLTGEVGQIDLGFISDVLLCRYCLGVAFASSFEQVFILLLIGAGHGGRGKIGGAGYQPAGEIKMSDTVVVALISSGGACLIGVTALLLNYRGFTSIENRLGVIEHDVKEFYRLLGLHDTEIARLKDKTGLS